MRRVLAISLAVPEILAGLVFHQTLAEYAMAANTCHGKSQNSMKMNIKRRMRRLLIVVQVVCGALILGP
jgi:hypothetical protein